jgi:hypothetical protein
MNKTLGELLTAMANGPVSSTVLVRRLDGFELGETLDAALDEAEYRGLASRSYVSPWRCEWRVASGDVDVARQRAKELGILDVLVIDLARANQRRHLTRLGLNRAFG